jgi:hypothetical protein
MLPEAFRRALEDPPQVHPDASSGVYSTSLECYELMSDRVGGSSVTLETGLGLSTVLFALLGCEHTSIFGDAAEGDALAEWAGQRGIDLAKVHLYSDGSEVVLPTLNVPELDLFFIDGQHGYPVPQMDWLFGAGRLRRGGVVVVDDLQLWAPAQLADFLDADSRWRQLERHFKWAAYERLSEGPLNSDFWNQPFPPRKPPATVGDHVRNVARRLPRPVREAADKVRRRSS